MLQIKQSLRILLLSRLSLPYDDSVAGLNPGQPEPHQRKAWTRMSSRQEVDKILLHQLKQIGWYVFYDFCAEQKLQMLCVLFFATFLIFAPPKYRNFTQIILTACVSPSHIPQQQPIFHHHHISPFHTYFSQLHLSIPWKRTWTPHTISSLCITQTFPHHITSHMCLTNNSNHMIHTFTLPHDSHITTLFASFHIISHHFHIFL